MEEDCREVLLERARVRVRVRVDLMTVDVMNVQQQKGGNDCGVFAVAFATSLVFGQCPTHRQYTQKQM